LGYGLTWETVCAAVEQVYRTLDAIDTTLLESGSPRLAGLVELANLSSMLGNILATGIVRVAPDVFGRAGPHKYQDLRALSAGPGSRHIEIKVALEGNNPKGHLAKEGQYLVCRYVLGDESGHFTIGERGDVVWIWEIRYGYIEQRHFNVSNTPGDSGKTAVVSAEGMEELLPIYFDKDRCPYSLRSRRRQELEKALLLNPICRTVT